MKNFKLVLLILIIVNFKYASSQKLLNEKSIEEIKESLDTKITENGLFEYKEETFNSKEFIVHEILYSSSSFMTLYRIYGDNKKIRMFEKKIDHPKGIINPKLEKIEIISSDIKKYEKELYKFGFWNIKEYNNFSICIDGVSRKISAIKGNELININSHGCSYEKEITVQLQNEFYRIFKID